MTALRVRDTFPKYPEYADAILELRPGKAFSISENDYSTLNWYEENDDEKPTESEILSKLDEMIEKYNASLYRKNRYLEYASVEEQLEMLYNDIKSGNLENGTWINHIDSIKNNHPKP
jgi:hypothetical protein